MQQSFSRVQLKRRNEKMLYLGRAQPEWFRRRKFPNILEILMIRTLSLLALTLFASTPLMAQTAEMPAEKPAKKPAAKKPAAAKKTTTVAGIAHVRFLHAAAGAPAVDIYARETEKIKTGLDYKGLTEYTDVKSGKMALKVTAANKMEALVKDAATLTKEKFYTIAICMDKATPMMVLINESSGKDYPDKARVRVVNLVSGSDGVAVTKSSTRAADGSANFLSKPVLFGKSSSKTGKPTTETIQFRDAAGKSLKEMPDMKLDAGERYSAFVIGKAGGTGADAVDVVVKTAAK